MSRIVYIDGARVELTNLIGQGGEAEVYDLGDGRVVKWWKPADHPDFDGMPEQQAAAARRIAEAPAKLRALPGRLPAAVVAPSGFALVKKHVVGYVMPKVSGTALHCYGEPRWRLDNPIDGNDIVAMLLALHDAIAGLHRAGVVIGDCNDLNVLVDGRRVHLIDVDSYQFGGFACSMFSERFVDPRLCSGALVPVRSHDEDSDWFAFAVMAFRTLLGVGPWGGVTKACPQTQRALERISVLDPSVTYPRAAQPIASLPDEVVETFRAIFERDIRGVFPRALLERLRFRNVTAHLAPAVVHGNVRWQPIPMPAAATPTVWLDGGALMRKAAFGPERIGSVLANQTRIWAGDSLGIGFYRAGGYAVGFVFRPDRGPLDDRVALPKIRGRLVDAHAVVGADRAWLFLDNTCVVVDAHANVLATDTIDASWLAGIHGACAAGNFLFVPTDDGVTRVEIVNGAIAATRVFAETASLVSASDKLALSPGGLDVIRRRDAIRMQLT